MTRTLAQIINAVADDLALRESGTATGGTSTTIVAANYPWRTSRSGANAKRYEGAEVYIDSSNWTGTPNPNDVSVYAPSTGTLTVGNTYVSDTPASGDTFSVFLRGVSRNTIKDCVNEALRELRYRMRVPLTVVVDGDMESSTMDAWADEDATLSKVSLGTGTTLQYGAKMLYAISTATGGYAQSDAILVNPTHAPNWVVQSTVQATVGTARLIAWDLTNSAEIESEDYALRGPGVIQFTFTLPATCESIAFRLMGVASGDEVYWENVIAYPVGARVFGLPTYLTRPGQILQVGYTPAAGGRADQDRFRRYSWWKIRRNDSSPEHPLVLEIEDPDLHYPSYIDVSRPFAALATDSATTFCDQTLIEAATAVELLRRLQNRAPGLETDAWRNEYRHRLREFRALRSRLSPPEGELRFSEPF